MSDRSATGMRVIELDLIAKAVQFDETLPGLVRAAEMSEHTEDVRLDWDRPTELGVAEVIA